MDMKKTVHWVLVGVVLFLVIGSIAAGGFGWLFGLLAAALLAPIDSWQKLLAKYLTPKLRYIVAAILAFVLLCTFGPYESKEGEKEPLKFGETTPEQEEETSDFFEKEPAPETPPTEELPAIDSPAPEEVPEEVHTHSFIAATCTKAKTCSSCGEVEGDALGHNWSAATCQSPKTCSRCGATEGGKAAHRFSEGNCSSCGAEDPNYQREEMVWIPTKGGKRYHSNSGCSQMDDPDYVTISEAKSRGFSACGRCYK